jgi:Fe-S oxidoreductase
MTTEAPIPNRWKDERETAGIATAHQLAKRADVDPDWYDNIEQGRTLPTADELQRLTTALGIPASRLYAIAYRQLIPGQAANTLGERPSTYFRDLTEHSHMLVSRDELAWFERQPGANHRADVFMNLSCAAQLVPNLLLDTVAVLERLDVSFVAAAGAPACCGKPFLHADHPETTEGIGRARILRTVGWGAKTQVNWCTACQAMFTAGAARRSVVDGVDHPVREVQVLTFLEQRVRELGDRVPWRKPVPRRVLVEGHPAWGVVARDAQEAGARLLSLIPGVQVVDLYDGHSDESPCTMRGRDPGWTPPPEYERRNTAEDVGEHRTTLADYADSRGADTVSCQHQSCHALWSRYASDRLAVRHAVSILAEALGCAHPDRYQAAARLGNPDEFLSQTREVWQSWSMTESRARELAAGISDPTYADAATQHSCGGHGDCRENLVTVDVLAGALRPG